MGPAVIFDFLTRQTLRRRRAIATAAMVGLSVAWIAGTVFALVVLIASAFVKGRPAGQYYFLLSEQVPTVSSDLALAALIAFPVSAAIGLLVGWYYMHEDDFRRAVCFNLAPCLNLIVLAIDALL